MRKVLLLWQRWWAAIVVMGLIFLFSSVPARQMPEFGGLDFVVKKGGHFLGYGMLALSYLHGLGRDRPGAAWLAWLLSACYAATDELHQTFVPGRGAWIVDVGIDSAGAALSLLLSQLRQ